MRAAISSFRRRGIMMRAAIGAPLRCGSLVGATLSGPRQQRAIVGAAISSSRRRREPRTIAVGGGGLGVGCRRGGHARARARPWFRAALWRSPVPRRLRTGRPRRRRTCWLGLMHTPVPAGTRLRVVRLGRPSATTANRGRRRRGIVRASISCSRRRRSLVRTTLSSRRRVQLGTMAVGAGALGIALHQTVSRRCCRAILLSPHPNQAAGRVVLRQAVGHQPLQQLPVFHRRVDVRQKVAQLLQPALAVPVDHRLQLPAVAPLSACALW